MYKNDEFGCPCEGFEVHLAIPSAFSECMTIEEMIRYLYKYCENLDDHKQDKLIPGKNITIVDNVISATGGGGGGVTANIDASASVDQSIGNASVNVTKTVIDDTTTFDFAFSGIKGERGEQGIPGVPGPAGSPGVPGSDGFSPVVSVTEVEGGHKVSITDSTGTKAFDVLDGSPGPAGEQGIPGPAGPSDVTPILTEGVQIATINGEAIYAPQGGGGSVEVFESTTDTDAFSETYQSISFFSIRKVGRLVNLNGLFYMSNGFTNTSLAKLLQAFCPERNLEFVCDIDVRTLNGTDWESISKYENVVYPSNRSKTTLAINSDGSVVLKPATVLKIDASDIAIARVFVNVTYVTAE